MLAPEVVFVISGIDFHFAVADFEDARGQLVDEIAVVGDKDDRAGVLHQRFEQDVFGAQVEVVGGLVEQQEVGGVQQHFQQRVTIALASGEDADTLKDIVSREKETAEQAAQFGLRRGSGEFAEIVENAGFGIELFVLVLREVVEMDFVAEFVFARSQRFSCWARSLIRVDFPAPLTPTSAMRSPRSIMKFTLSKTLCSLMPRSP